MTMHDVSSRFDQPAASATRRVGRRVDSDEPDFRFLFLFQDWLPSHRREPLALLLLAATTADFRNLAGGARHRDEV